MKKTIGFLLTVLTSAVVLAEEFSDIPQSERNKKFFGDAILVSDLVRGASCAGVGQFLNEPSPSTLFVDIHVQQWWTPPLATNIVRIHELDPYSTNWVFPTNVPVVFFALTKRQMYDGTPALVSPDQYPPEWVYSITNAAEMAKLMFSDTDRSWFRTTRDNGIVYVFATNLWSCMRANPNPTNYYEVLRDAERTVSKQDSWRVHFDAYEGLSWFLDAASESYLAEKLNDPLLSPIMRNSVGNRLRHRYGWTYNYTNNVEVWTPPQ